ncbi:MAG: ABC transporter permease [Chloroflexota bacterium]
MASTIKSLFNSLLIPILALVTALVVGAIVMLTFGDNPLEAYRGLLLGAFGNDKAWARTIIKMTPLILTGLSVAVAFKSGLFNIGAAGQFLFGTVCSVAVGIAFDGLPMIIHLPLSLLAGIIGGMIWGAIPGLLKVYTGAHEVITTIMLNYIAALFGGWTVYAGGSQGQTPGPLWDPSAGAISETPDVLSSAQLPYFFDSSLKLHWGVLIAPLVALFIWWLIYKTTFGFEIRTVGQNSGAARYAGINVNRTIVLTMAIAGGLAGLAGAIETLGLNHKFAPEFGGAAGFDGIIVALLGQAHPVGVILAAFMFGSLIGGASRMQFESGVSADIINVIQALVLTFVAAPAIIRMLFRLGQSDEEDQPTFSAGWGAG